MKLRDRARERGEAAMLVFADLLEERDRDVWSSSVVGGETLQSVGRRVGLTRERVRQIRLHLLKVFLAGESPYPPVQGAPRRRQASRKAIEERRDEVLRLRRAGLTERAVADQLGEPSGTIAYDCRVLRARGHALPRVIRARGATRGGCQATPQEIAERRAQVLRLRQYLSERAVAEQLDLPGTLVAQDCRALRRLGHTFPSSRPAWTPVDQAAIAECLLQGLSPQKTAVKTQASVAWVYEIRRRLIGRGELRSEKTVRREVIAAHPNASVRELAEKLGVTAETVRRDRRKLDEEGGAV